MRLDFANSAIAAGASVGVDCASGGSPVATFKFVGNDPLGVYRYDDLGGRGPKHRRAIRLSLARFV